MEERGGRCCLYPANPLCIDREVLVDDLPSVKLWGRRFTDGKEGWFHFSPILGSYHAIWPEWGQRGDEVEFYEPLPDGRRRSLLLPGVKVAGGSVSRIELEDGNILLISNVAGVHQSYRLLKPQELDKIDEIIVDTVYVEESCPRCGSANVFHLGHLGPPKSYSRCLNCGYDWQGKLRSELVLVRDRAERAVVQELERFPHLRQILLEGKGREEVPPLV
jgi:transposase-like protein